MKLANAVQEYTDYRRSLGKRFRSDSSRLEAFLRQTGDTQLDNISRQQVEAYLKGKGEPITPFWFTKFHALQRFFRYAVSRLHMAYRSLLPTSLPKMPPRLTPYLYSIEEMRRLLGVADSCYHPLWSVDPHTMRTLLLLLYGTGLRIGEALRLTISELNLNDGVLTVRNTKFFKSRLVPIGSDLKRMLGLYYERQWAGRGHAPNSPFFCTKNHRAVTVDKADRVFAWLRTEAGVLRFDNERYQPRLHDFRHTFAVIRLVTWYREGKDVQRLLPHLSTYLGHVHIDDTANYLTMTKELLQEASRCFERYALQEVRHG
jgi:integrase/recombinase XerD